MVRNYLTPRYPLFASINLSPDENDRDSTYLPRLYKVPVDQRRANPDAYTPFLFSFGPYHTVSLHEDIDADNHVDSQQITNLVDGDYLKWRTASGLLSTDLLEGLIDTIEKDEIHIHAQYVQWLRLQSDNFRRLATNLALDAITIVAATLSQEHLSKCTPLIYPLTRLALNDAILLENQVPIYVLDCAVNSINVAGTLQAAQPEAGSAGSPLISANLEDVIYWYCKRANPFPDWAVERLRPAFSPTSNININMDQPLLAFLYDHLYNRFTYSSRSPSSAVDLHSHEDPSLSTASHLARCGVQFRPCGTGYSHFDSRAGVLLLPRITVSDTTVRVLHNLLAYEATARLPGQYSVVSYVHFMDRLIDTTSDVQILTEANVISNILGSHEELASMWNKLCISVSHRNTYQDSVTMSQLETFSKKRWRRWRASFKELYWESKPWLLLSIVAAMILFVLTLLQTIFTILS